MQSPTTKLGALSNLNTTMAKFQLPEHLQSLITNLGLLSATFAVPNNKFWSTLKSYYYNGKSSTFCSSQLQNWELFQISPLQRSNCRQLSSLQLRIGGTFKQYYYKGQITESFQILLLQRYLASWPAESPLALPGPFLLHLDPKDSTDGTEIHFGNFLDNN